MNVTMFIVGAVIFSIYIYFTIWNIFYGARKNREENYPGYYDRHGMDLDGMGNFSRFGSEKRVKEVSRKKYKRKKKDYYDQEEF